MAFRTISQFKGQLAGGGVRPNLFEVELNFPNGAGQTLGFMSNEALLPLKTQPLTILLVLPRKFLSW